MEWFSLMLGGRSFLEPALLIGLFWAALVHPDRIRSRHGFRLATILLCVSIISPLLGQLAMIADLGNGLQNVAMGMGDAEMRSVVTIVFQEVHLLTLMLAVLFALVSVSPSPRLVDEAAPLDRPARFRSPAGLDRARED